MENLRKDNPDSSRIESIQNYVYKEKHIHFKPFWIKQKLPFLV